MYCKSNTFRQCFLPPSQNLLKKITVRRTRTFFYRIGYGLPAIAKLYIT